MRVFNCYVCNQVAQLSQRSRCATCEYERAKANERENELLRMEIEALQEDIDRIKLESSK